MRMNVIISTRDIKSQLVGYLVAKFDKSLEVWVCVNPSCHSKHLFYLIILFEVNNLAPPLIDSSRDLIFLPDLLRVSPEVIFWALVLSVTFCDTSKFNIF